MNFRVAAIFGQAFAAFLVVMGSLILYQNRSAFLPRQSVRSLPGDEVQHHLDRQANQLRPMPGGGDHDPEATL